MTDNTLTDYYAQCIPVDPDTLMSLGLVTWAAIMLQHRARDVLGLDLGTGLLDKPFDLTLGAAITRLTNIAGAKGEPRSSEILDWAFTYGKPAVQARNGIMHAVAYTADDGRQALRHSSTHGTNRIERARPPTRAAGLLELASVKLVEALDRCGKVDVS